MSDLRTPANHKRDILRRYWFDRSQLVEEDVWNIAIERSQTGHNATFPKELARRCIVAGCPVGGVTLDPFVGSGTVPLVAREERRRYVGIELNPDYASLTIERLSVPRTLPMLFAESEGA
jgi:DNA modification methylase